MLESLGVSCFIQELRSCLFNHDSKKKRVDILSAWHDQFLESLYTFFNVIFTIMLYINAIVQFFFLGQLDTRVIGEEEEILSRKCHP